MSATQNVGRSTIYLGIGRVVSLLAALGTVKVLTGYLGDDGFGQYNIILDYLGFFAILIDLGLHLLSVQAITDAETDEERDQRLSSIVSLRVVVGLIAFAVAATLILFFPYEEKVKQGIVIASFSFLSYSLVQLSTGIFQGFMRAELGAISEAIGKAAVFGFVFLCARLGGDFTEVMMALVAGNGLGALLALVFMRRLFRLRFLFRPKEYESVLRDGIPLGIVMVMSYLYVKQDTLILSLYPYMPDHISNNEAIGVYKVSYKLLETIQGFPALFLTALFPFLTKNANIDGERFRTIAQKAFDFLVGIAIPLVVGTLLLAHEIIPILTSGDHGWERSVLTLQILIFAVSFSFLNNFANHIVTAYSEQKRLIIPSILYLLLNFGLNMFLIAYFAHNGAAAATVVTEITVFVVNFWIVWKATGWRPHVKAFPPVFLCSGLMGGVVYLLDWQGLNVFVTTFSGIGVYYLLAGPLGALPEGMRGRELVNRLVGTKTEEHPPQG